MRLIKTIKRKWSSITDDPMSFADPKSWGEGEWLKEPGMVILMIV